MKKDEEDQPVPNIEEPSNTKSGAKVRPPNWLGEDERAKWLLYPEWRSTFQREKSRTAKQFLCYALRTNGIAIAAALIIAFVIRQTTPQTYFDTAALISIGNISCATAAAVMSIILFFVVFFFGRAGELEDQARNSIRHEIASLELSADQLSEFAWAKVREDVPDFPKNTELKHLIATSKEFRSGILELIGVFSRATRGTFYDSGKLYLLHKHISKKGGDWYVAHRSLFTSPEGRDFALKVWRDVTMSSSNILKLNDDIQLAEDQYDKASQVSFALPSLLMLVVLALVIIFGVTVLPTGFAITLLSIVLMSLLTTQILLLMRWAVILVYRETVVRRANREADRKYSEKVTRVDEHEMIQDMLEYYERASEGMKRQENNKPNGTKSGSS